MSENHKELVLCQFTQKLIYICQIKITFLLQIKRFKYWQKRTFRYFIHLQFLSLFQNTCKYSNDSIDSLFHLIDLFIIFQSKLNKNRMYNIIQNHLSLQINQESKKTMEPEVCKFWIERKKRQCKFSAIKGSLYCSSHCSDMINKIQCPFQKGIYIDKEKYEKHIKNCPKIKQKNKVKQSTWFSQGVNLSNQASKQTQQKFFNLSTVPQEKIKQAINSLINIMMKEFGDPEKMIISTQLQKTPEQANTNDHKQAYLLAESAYNKDLISSNFIYIQFGAGKGILSYAIAKKVSEVCKVSSKNILLQRQSRRNKFDKHFRDNPCFQRFKSDVSDFNMKKIAEVMIEKIKNDQTNLHTKKQENKNRKVQQKQQLKKIQQNTQNKKIQNKSITQEQLDQLKNQLEKCSIIGICKHMCGLALDISVRGMLATKVGGYLLASCCHHLCTPESYLNPQFFIQKHQVSKQIMHLIFKLSSWGTKSQQVEKKDIDLQKIKNSPVSQLKDIQKVVIGRMCKRIIDKGRAQILGGTVQRYCSDQLTPQNFVIVSKKLI